jgi:hypothetical protein
MFKSFFHETKWFLLAIAILTAVLVGNIFYWQYEENRIAKENEGIPPWIWNPEETEFDIAKKKGLEFKKLSDNLYSLTGHVAVDDCEKIVPELPIDGTPFTVILESPGGSLFDGVCLAAHFKQRNVVTVVRDTPIIDDEGKVLYEPGLVGFGIENPPKIMDGVVICASSCTLMFLGGDYRYLIGDVWLGIHSPRIPEESLSGISKQAIESQAYRASAGIMMLLDALGITSNDVKYLFLQVPATSMYWLHPRDFEYKPQLGLLATHFRDFWDFNFEQPLWVGTGTPSKSIEQDEMPPEGTVTQDREPR